MKTRKAKVGPGEKAFQAYSILIEKKAQEPVVLDLRELTLITDFFIICHGTSEVNTRGLADALLDEMAKRGIKNARTEGYTDAQWILVDFGDVIVHIFSEEQREFYSLERLWGDAPLFANETEVRELLTGSASVKASDG